MKVLSLRARVFFGAALWSIGLFLGGGFILTHLMLVMPEAPDAFHRFFYRHMFFVSIATIASMLIGLSLVKQGLASFDELRARLFGVRDGRDLRLEGEYPVEVKPLVDDLNALLADREQRIAKAHRKAGDLAHGLKTPLTLLNQHAEHARTTGQVDLANAIHQHVERMRRQIDYHLAHARASASEGNPSTRCHVLTSADALARTMMTLHAEKRVTVDVHVPPDQFVRSQREDLEEMLGNLVDNACKWATSRVTIQSSSSNGRTDIVVEDDGPGLAAELRETVLQRGVRADEAAPGSGLGLAIVADLVELYGGSIHLASSALGGLRATLTLPSA